MSAACLSPATRPAKIKQGFSGTVSGAVLYGAVNEQRCFSDCVNNEDDEIDTINLVQFDGRWGHRLSENSGIALGGYLSGESTDKLDGQPLVPNFYFQTGVDGGPFSGSLAIEFGPNVIGTTGTVQVTPFPEQPSASLAAYARALRAIRRRDLSPNSPEVTTWDAGVALRFARVFAQYSYYSRLSGRDTIEDGFESSVRARDWHILSVGHEF